MDNTMLSYFMFMQNIIAALSPFTMVIKHYCLVSLNSDRRIYSNKMPIPKHRFDFLFCFVFYYRAVSFMNLLFRMAGIIPSFWLNSLAESLFCKSLCYLTHWGRDNMAAISQTTLSNAFSWIKMLEFRLKYHWSLFIRVKLTIFQHWFR